MKNVPVIDLSLEDKDLLVQQIAQACADPGFFQVLNHGIPASLLHEFRNVCELYFDLPMADKMKTKRNAGNARGYFNDELTKQRRDWKECCDVGRPGSLDWSVADAAEENACLDGWNQFPEALPKFRSTVVDYFEACAKLSQKLAELMALGLNVPEDDPFLLDLHANHTSYLRMNYYPTCPEEKKEDGNLGISPHKDAGFLTVLLQDDGCHSLQVLDEHEQWSTVRPVPGALTINTGDMAQVWSNNRYQAPLHRVLTNETHKRYSAPFFYNPGYRCLVSPLDTDWPKYHPVLWGYFRAVRFAGDLTNLGVEIQIDDYWKENERESHHLKKQVRFVEENLADRPFNVDTYRDLLLE